MTRVEPGFTLIELLVVVSIIGVLMGLLFPVMGVAKRSADRANSMSLMRKVDSALLAFRQDAGAFPYAKPPVDAEGPWVNDLGYRLNHELSSAGHDNLSGASGDLSAIRTAYRSGAAAVTGAMIDQPLNAVSISGATWTDAGDKDKVAICVNRLGTERACVALLAGHTQIAYTTASGSGPWVDGGVILSSPASRGWASDYLGGNLTPRERSLDANGIPASIIDRWNNPLVYINPVIPGVNGFVFQGVSGTVSAEWFGLAPRPRSSTTALASDARTTAARENVNGYELWSAGPDRGFDALRDQPANRDNLGLQAYTKALK
ncbi:MAG TPA: hypothetical protein DCS97_03540 [Planctomycetes bacterium]|nr:hypothetical protein [Planctomycetota bacterium]